MLFAPEAVILCLKKVGTERVLTLQIESKAKILEQ